MRVDGGSAEDVVRQTLAREFEDDERCELLRRFDAAVEETPPVRRPILPVDVPLEPPPRRAPKPSRLDDPRLRQLARPVPTTTEGSWWTKPDADWKAEQQRMHVQGRSSAENLIGWKAVGTKTDDRPRGRW